MDHSDTVENPGEEKEREYYKKMNWACHCLPKRYLLAILSFLGFLNVYSLRVNLSVAIVAMVSNRTVMDTSGNATFVPAEFAWTSKEQGMVLSSFFYGYILTQIPGGYLAARFGGKNLYGGGILMTALFTLLTPLAAKANMYLLVTIRVLEGFFEGVTFPCMHAIWSKWAPPMERSKLATISFSGPFAGTVIGMTFSGLLAESHGWPSVFYFFGILGIIWSVLWFWMVTDSPLDHPTITKEELEFLKQELADDKTEMSVDNVPWKDIFSSVPVWAIIVAHVAENWGYYTLLTTLPTYLKRIQKFDLKNAGFLSALPYLVMIIVVQCGGRLADWLRSSGRLSTTTVRKLFNTLGFAAQAIFIVVVGYSTEKHTAVLAVTLAVGFGGIAWSGFIINHLDIAPRYASLLLGVSNCFATVPGMVSPLIVGFVTVNETKEEWRIIFLVAAGVYAFGAIFFLIFATGVKQPWAQTNGYDSLTGEDEELLMDDRAADTEHTDKDEIKEEKDCVTEEILEEKDRIDLKGL